MRGTWAHVHALTEIWKASERAPADAACCQFREKYLRKLYPVNQSPLFHNVNAQVLVVTRDNQIVVARRKRGVLCELRWTTSLEEQMLWRRQNDGLADADPFQCAKRGAKDELGVTALHGYPKLLGIGIVVPGFQTRQ